MNGKISFAEFARQVNVSRAAVTIAADEGRLRFHVEKDERGKEHKFLILEEALADWGVVLDKASADPAPGGLADSAFPLSDDVEKAEGIEFFLNEAGPDDDLPAGTPALYISKAKREHLRAQREELLLQKERGQVIPREEVEREAGLFVKLICDALDRLPDLAPALAAESNSKKIEILLKNEIRTLRENIASGKPGTQS